MIRIGLRTDFSFVPEAAELDYDYLELPLTQIAALSDEEFDELCEYLSQLAVRVEAVWDMLPIALRINGPVVSAQAQHAYLAPALDRASRLGAKIVAFDAPASRNVPVDFDFALARRQTGNFLRIAQGHAAQSDVRIAVQNFRRAECNLINTISEASLMAALLQLENVGVLADTVQMALASESLDAVERAGSSLMHVHTGCALKRTLPMDGDGEDYEKLFTVLVRSGYDGGVTAVSLGEQTAPAARGALLRLRRALDKALSNHSREVFS